MARYKCPSDYRADPAACPGGPFMGKHSLPLPHGAFLDARAQPPAWCVLTPLFVGGAFDSAKNHKRQSVAAKRAKSQTPKFV